VINAIQHIEVRKYFSDVLSGKVLACKLVKKALQRHLSDLQKTIEENYPYFFCHKSGVHVIQFFDYLRDKGKAFELQPFQKAILYIVFGWKKKDTGFRRFKKVYIEIPRKNGKTTFCSGLSLYMLLADNEIRPEVYFAATSRDQAKLGYNGATAIAKQSPSIRKRLIIQKYQIENPKNYGFMRPLSAEAGSLEGLNVHCGITDEMHVHKTDEVINAIDQGMGARDQPLSFEITTAGNNLQSVGYDHHKYSRDVLNNTIQDESWFAIIYSLDKGDEKKWSDPAIWAKANPGLGAIKKLDYMRDYYQRALNSSTFKNTFFIKDLNVWRHNEESWVDVDRFKATTKDISLENFKKRPCILGLDLASKSDISSLAIIFPTQENSLEGAAVFWKHYIPLQDIEARTALHKVPYDIWHRAGYFTATDGNVTDYNKIMEDIIALKEVYDIQAFCYDPYQAYQLAITLQSDYGINAVEVNQTMPNLGPPTAHLERCLHAENFQHPADPPAEWMLGNVMVIKDTNNNIKLDKKRSKEKIDAWPALVNAVFYILTEGVRLEQKKQIAKAINW
jgi:phage terminase large subunit-like protein